MLADIDERLHTEHLDSLLEGAERRTALLEKMRVAAAARVMT
ncbi:hypothetical protein [Streptomyces sp. NBC_00467]